MIETISVVIPHYGDPKHAAALVGQLTSQIGAPALEVIVVDDASPRPYPKDERVKLIRRVHNGGFGAAVNSGVAQARHSHVLVLNSDLTIGPTFVADLSAVAGPFQPAVVGPMVVGHDGASQWPGRKFPRTSHYFIEWLTILARYKDKRWHHTAIGHDLHCVEGVTQPVDWVTGVAMLIPVDAFRAVGGFDERFHMNCEEVDLQRRLRAREVRSIFAGGVTLRHIGGASSGDHRRRVRRLVESRLRYAEKWQERPSVVRLAIAVASVLNLATNASRRMLGRTVAPLATFRMELAALNFNASKYLDR